MKNTIHRVLNLFLYLVFCTLVGSGLLLAYRLPPGSRGGHGLELLGMSRHDWGDIHLWLGYAMLLGVILHLAMNWQWLRKIAAKARIWMLALGLGVGVAIISAFLLAPIEQTSRRHEGEGGKQKRERIHQTDHE